MERDQEHFAIELEKRLSKIHPEDFPQENFFLDGQFQSVQAIFVNREDVRISGRPDKAIILTPAGLFTSSTWMYTGSGTIPDLSAIRPADALEITQYGDIALREFDRKFAQQQSQNSAITHARLGCFTLQ